MARRRRPPADPAETRALQLWRDASPVAAMRALVAAGYGYPERAAFLCDVAGLDAALVPDFAADTYVADFVQPAGTVW